MANPAKSVPENVPGEFFVDSTCIDCDTCRQLAPTTFGAASDYSFVQTQPDDDQQVVWATRALLACPTGSIGTRSANRAKQVWDDFPLPLDGPVYYSGFNSPKSYGGNSYFVRHADGNWLIDSPKFLPRLAKRFAELGGIARIFLTHRDDVADARAYARRFDAQRTIHELEFDSQPDAEIVLAGNDPIDLGGGFLAIPTPGHTAGHCVLLYRQYLFSGDHLWWNREDQRLAASHSYCWHSWREQIASMARLTEFDFEWVLPGHGQRVALPATVMREELHRLVERMHVIDRKA